MKKRGHSVLSFSVKQKRGLSEVITTLVFILLAIIAVAVTWIVISNVLSSGEGVQISTLVTKVDLDPTSVNVTQNGDSYNLSMVLTKNSDAGNVDSLEIIVVNSTDVYRTRVSTTLKDFERTRIEFFILNRSLDPFSLESVTVIPVLKGEKGQESYSAISPKYNFQEKTVSSVNTASIISTFKSIESSSSTGGGSSCPVGQTLCSDGICNTSCGGGNPICTDNLIVLNTPYSSTNTNVSQENTFAHLGVSNSVPYNSLVAYYPFDDGASSSIAYDYSRSYDGTINGATLNSLGKYGSAMNFDTNQYVNINPMPMTKTDDFAFSWWMNPSNLNQLGFAISYGSDNGANGDGFAIGIGNGAGGTGSRLTGLTPGVAWRDLGYTFPSNNTWYNVAWVRTGGRTKVYVNGVNVYNNILSMSTPTKLTIGSQQTAGRYLKGSVDDVMIFDTALTDLQVQNIYNAQSSRFNSVGEQKFSNLDLSSTGNEDTLDILTNYKSYSGSKVSVKVNEGSYVDLASDGSASGIALSGNLNSVNLTFKYSSGSNSFFTPLLVGDITLNSYPQQCLFSSVCGDGNIGFREICDDGDATSGDGCSSTCHVESSWTCSGEPSVCSQVIPAGSYVIAPSLPTITPVSVPTPVPVTMPTPNRILRVGDNAGFNSALSAAQAGDWIILAPGNYAQLLIQNRNIGTANNYLVIAGEPGAKVNGASVYMPSNDAYIKFYAMNFTNSVSINYARHVDVIGSQIFVSTIYNQSDDRPNLGINHQTDESSFRILNNHIFTPLISTRDWGVGSDGIYFSFYEGKGNNTRIAGNQINGAWDGMSLGQSGGSSPPFNNPTNNWSVDHNVIYDVNDDAIEADGWHSYLTISNNIIGGTNADVRMGVSLAPCGPGPVYVKDNYISGFSESAVKFNTDVNQAYCKNALIKNNTIVQTGDGINWPTETVSVIYIPNPVTLVENASYINNIIYSVGTFYITEQMNFTDRFYFDYNTLWSTKEKCLWGGSGATCVLFRPQFIWNGSSTMMYSIEELRDAAGWEIHGQYLNFSVQPVQVGNIPIEKLAKWRVFDSSGNPLTGAAITGSVINENNFTNGTSLVLLVIIVIIIIVGGFEIIRRRARNRG